MQNFSMSASTSNDAAAPATDSPRRSLRTAARLAACATCLALLGTGIACSQDLWREQEVRSQQELSRVVGPFRASRYVVYEGGDGRFHWFRERSKFGWLGPSATIKVPVSVIELPGAVKGDVFTYVQNAGQFKLSSDRRSQRPDRTYAANFVERHTVEEERYLKALARLEALGPSTDLRPRSAAFAELMRASYWAGRPDETIRHATSVIELGRATVPDDLHAAHILLGMIALERGDIETAKRELLSSAAVDGSPTLSSFGPNLWLMQQVLKAGETQAALDYLEACKAFWKSRADELVTWQADIRAGRTPDTKGGASRYHKVH